MRVYISVQDDRSIRVVARLDLIACIPVAVDDMQKVAVPGRGDRALDGAPSCTDAAAAGQVGAREGRGALVD
eukprot:3134194-Rhodomonas_salina.1